MKEYGIYIRQGNCIKCREVGEWKTYSKEDENKIEDNKIIYFKDLKKTVDKIILLLYKQTYK